VFEFTLDFKPAHLYIETIEGVGIHANFVLKKKRLNYRIKKKAKVQTIPMVRKYFNDELLAHGCKYILSYCVKGKEERIIQIFSSGLMSEALQKYDEEAKTWSAFNGVPQEAMETPQQVSEFFNATFELFEMEFIHLLGPIIELDVEKEKVIGFGKEVRYRELRYQRSSYSIGEVHTEISS